MKKYNSIIGGLLLTVLSLAGCDKKTNANPDCHAIVVNQTFNAKIGEKWCIEEADWSIQFGPFLEDSRCNVDSLICVWAGRYVMAATIDNGDPAQDTFYAEHNWTDTLYNGPYSIILSKVYPETRQTMEALDPSLYSFDIIVKN